MHLCGKHAKRHDRNTEKNDHSNHGPRHRYVDPDKQVLAALGPDVMTPRDVASKTGLPRHTVQKVMLDLLKNKKLKRTGSHRTVRYVKA